MALACRGRISASRFSTAINHSEPRREICQSGGARGALRASLSITIVCQLHMSDLAVSWISSGTTALAAVMLLASCAVGPDFVHQLARPVVRRGAGPLKLAAVFIFGGGHLVAGLMVMLSAYLVSALLVERLFEIVKPKLLTLSWFVVIWKRFVETRRKAFRWLKSKWLPNTTRNHPKLQRKAARIGIPEESAGGGLTSTNSKSN